MNAECWTAFKSIGDADTKRHLDMGFYEGWGACITQLEALAQKLAAGKF